MFRQRRTEMPGASRPRGQKKAPGSRGVGGFLCGVALPFAASDVLGLRALLALDHVELNRIALGQALEPFALPS